MSNIAVINVSGSQHLVMPGYKVEVNRLENEVGSTFTPEVLLSTDGDKVLFNDGKLEVKVLEHKKGEKLHVIKFQAKSRYRKRTGHRQYLTVLEVLSINGEKRERSAKTANASVEEKPAKVAKAPKATAEKKTVKKAKVTK